MTISKKNTVLDKIQNISEYIKYLKQVKKEVGDNRKLFIDDFHYFGLAERYFQLAIQSIIDTVQLIVIEEGFKKPEDNHEAISVLFDNKVLTEGMAEKLEGVVGFRNLLVHEYGKIDKSKLYDYLQDNIDDLVEFKKEIIKYLK